MSGGDLGAVALAAAVVLAYAPGAVRDWRSLRPARKWVKFTIGELTTSKRITVKHRWDDAFDGSPPPDEIAAAQRDLMGQLRQQLMRMGIDTTLAAEGGAS